ncbi:MAG: hypothetical protein HQM16_05665 [Deltaproteobacteria bacterium]|nr:hypothetical protein [Deltaproteobacteria bacterium]
MVQDDLQKKGYNKEEEYFHKLNQKLIKDRAEATKNKHKGGEAEKKEENKQPQNEIKPN